MTIDQIEAASSGKLKVRRLVRFSNVKKKEIMKFGRDSHRTKEDVDLFAGKQDSLMTRYMAPDSRKLATSVSLK